MHQRHVFAVPVRWFAARNVQCLFGCCELLSWSNWRRICHELSHLWPYCFQLAATRSCMLDLTIYILFEYNSNGTKTKAFHKWYNSVRLLFVSRSQSYALLQLLFRPMRRICNLEPLKIICRSFKWMNEIEMKKNRAHLRNWAAPNRNTFIVHHRARTFFHFPKLNPFT